MKSVLIENGKVYDIIVTKYFLWSAMRNIFYFKNQIPEYRLQTKKWGKMSTMPYI